MMMMMMMIILITIMKRKMNKDRLICNQTSADGKESLGYYLSSLTVIAMTIIAVERWLHMSRRSLPTVCRVIIIYITFVVLQTAVFACYMYIWYYINEFLGVYIALLLVYAQQFVLLLLLSLILKFFKSYVTTKTKYKQIKMPLTSKNTENLYSQFCIFL